VLNADGNWADIGVHGGTWIVEQVLNLAEREGFQIVPPGLPVPDAAIDDDVCAIDGEVLQFLPMALTETAIRLLLSQPAAWRAALNKRVNSSDVLNDRTLWRLLHPPTVAIVGEPNVGKSTLANYFFGQQRSITADVPGTTRDWVGEMANIGGMPAMLIDTPGVRETPDPIERAAIAASSEKIREADLVIVVLDATSRSSLPAAGYGARHIVVVNKMDQMPQWDFDRLDAVRISAKSGLGCDHLVRAVQRGLGLDDFDESKPRWWTSRQRAILAEVASNSAPIAAKIIG